MLKMQSYADKFDFNLFKQEKLQKHLRTLHKVIILQELFEDI